MTTTSSHAPVVAQPPGPKTARDLIESPRFSSEIAKALPATISVQQFLRLALTTLHRTPDLARCTQASVASCLLECAQLGLEPGGPLDRAYLIPYEHHKRGITLCTLQIGYKGLVELVNRSGKLRSLRAEVVREGDRFEYEYGLKETLVHRPLREQKGEIIYAYAIAWLDSDIPQWTVMPRVEIDSIRRSSRTGDSGPWASHFAAMARKTALRRLLKLLPMATQADLALEAEDRSHRDAGVYGDLPFAVTAAPSIEPPVQEVVQPAASTEPQPVDTAAVDAPPTDPDHAKILESVRHLASAKRVTGAKWVALVRRAAARCQLSLNPEASLEPQELYTPVLRAVEEDLLHA